MEVPAVAILFVISVGIVCGFLLRFGKNLYDQGIWNQSGFPVEKK